MLTRCSHLIVAVGSLARLFSDSAAYVVTAPCISRDSDLAQCSYQSNQICHGNMKCKLIIHV